MTADLFPDTVVPHVPGPKTWVPSAFVDEVTPAGRAHPSDWITWDGAGHPIRISFGDDSPETHLEIAPGETMMFDWSVDHGRVIFSIRPDGSYTTSRRIPPEANSFWVIGDPDTWGDSADEFARNMADNEFYSRRDYIDDGSEFEVGMVQWGDSAPFILAIDRAGHPAFLPALSISDQARIIGDLHRRRDDLLEANNRYLERARKAEAKFNPANLTERKLFAEVALREFQVEERHAMRGALDVLAERRRQIAKGYDAAHDNQHTQGEIISADWGALARLSGQAFEARRMGQVDAYRRLLVEGAAMVIAEIERIDRPSPETPSTSQEVPHG